MNTTPLKDRVGRTSKVFCPIVNYVLYSVSCGVLSPCGIFCDGTSYE